MTATYSVARSFCSEDLEAKVEANVQKSMLSSPGDHVFIFSMWYYPSHFGMHVDDIANHLDESGCKTTIVTVDKELFDYRYFDPVRHMFLTEWNDRSSVVRIPFDKLVDRGAFTPLLMLDEASPELAEVRSRVRSAPCGMLHFFEHFADQFNRSEFDGVRYCSLLYAGNFVARNLSHYGLPSDPPHVNLCLDANLAHLYESGSGTPALRGVDFVLSETRAFVDMLGTSHLTTPAYPINRPFNFKQVYAAPRLNIQRAFGLPADAKIVIYAGRPTKNARILPAVLRNVRALATDGYDVHLVLIGTQNYDVSAWDGYAEQCDHIHAITYLRRDLLYRYLKGADVLVYPSLIDGHAKIVSESQAAGLPVVAFDARASGTSELIVDGQTGVLVPECDVDALSRATHRLLSSAVERDRLAAHAREAARQTGVEAGFAAELAAICQLVGRGGVPPN